MSQHNTDINSLGRPPVAQSGHMIAGLELSEVLFKFTEPKG